MKITNEQIYKKLERIDKVLAVLNREEIAVLKAEKKIKMEEGALLKILNKNISLQFDNIIDWKRYIWDNCPYRKSHEKGKEIDFFCKKTSNKCRYADCFRNRN
jgi:hypothetical protein